MPHHLGEIRTDARTALVTGDPERVPRLASALGPIRHSWTRRGYVGAEAELDDRTVLVCSTGIGGPTAAIVVEELHEVGIEQVVRVGTCGAMQPHVNAGHLIVSTASVRDDGTSAQYAPPEFPASADHALTAAIVETATTLGRPLHVGVTHAKDAYYAEQPDRMPFAEHWRLRWQGLRALGVLATEMEAAALYVVAATHRMRAAAILVAVDDTLTAEAVLDALTDAARAAADGALTLERAVSR